MANGLNIRVDDTVIRVDSATVRVDSSFTDAVAIIRSFGGPRVTTR